MSECIEYTISVEYAKYLADGRIDNKLANWLDKVTPHQDVVDITGDDEEPLRPTLTNFFEDTCCITGKQTACVTVLVTL